MKKIRSPFWVMLPLVVFLSSCASSGQTQGPSEPDYKTMKAMVVDILQTEDAKKSVAEMMKDEKFKTNMLLDQETVKTTVIQSISDPKNPQVKEMFSDPMFASTLAKSMKTEHKKVIKDLMKDPEYQKMLISVMKDPEFEKSLLELMKSSAYRQQTMQVIKESMQSPLFQAEMLKLMTKATEEAMKPQKKSQSGGGGGGEGSSGGGGGGGSGEGGGG